jgi:hypothetical protein
MNQPPQSFYTFVCKSVDRTDRPPLRRRLEPVVMLIAQLLNIALVGAMLYFLGWLALFSTGVESRHFSWTYLTGVLLGLFGMASYVTMQSSFVILRNFIWPL